MNCFFLAVANGIVNQMIKEGKFSACDDREQLVAQIVKEKFKEVKECDGINPVQVRDINAWEEAQWPDLRVVVTVIYQNEINELIPVRHSPKVIEDKIYHVILLLSYFDIPDFKNDVDTVGHYALFNNAEDYFVHRQRDRHGKIKYTSTSGVMCYNCFNYIHRGNSYNLHVSWCHKKTGQKIIMPDEGDVTSYYPSHKEELTGYVIVYDFETLGSAAGVVPCSCSEKTRTLTHSKKCYDEEMEAMTHVSQLSPPAAEWHSLVEFYSQLMHAGQMTKKEVDQILKLCPHRSKVVKHQKPYAFSAAIINRQGKLEEHKTYFGEDAGRVFVKTVLDWSEEYTTYLMRGGKEKKKWGNSQLQIMSRHKGQDPNVCYLCNKPFCNDPDEVNYKNYKRVVDHCHVTGNFKGLAHSICNLHRKEHLRIPCLAHNFSGFDGNIVMQELCKVKAKKFFDQVDFSSLTLGLSAQLREAKRGRRVTLNVGK